MRLRPLTWLLAAVTLLAACGPAASPSEQTRQSASPRSSGPKSFVWLLNREPEGFSELFGGSQSNHWRMPYEAMHDFLVVLDNNAEPVKRLATDLPSRDTGSWRINPDGTMETTWKLRSDAKWHNGEPFRAADHLLGWRVLRDPDVPNNKRAIVALIDRMETPDDHTLVIHWSKLYPYADRIQPFDLDPLPSWNTSLVDTFENRKPELSSHPWFNREFVGLGPYRLATWVQGSHFTLEAADTWYGGRAKIDRIDARFILDDNARLATMLSGDGDFTYNFDLEHSRIFEEQAVRAGRGQLIRHTVGRLQLAVIKQANPIFGGPDRVRQRQAMLTALDRESLAEIMSGDPNNVADSWLFRGSPKYEALKDRVVRYPYNQTEALRLLGEAGWTRGSDGTLRDASGQPYAFEYWQADTAASIVRDSWQQIGMQVTLFERPPHLNADLEFRASFPGVQPTGNAVSLSFIDGRFHSRNIPTAANRFGGLNWGAYVDPEADRLIEQLGATIDQREAWQVEGDLLNLISRNVVYFPYYVDARPSAAKAGVSGIKPVNASCQSGDCEVSWNIHEWDITR